MGTYENDDEERKWSSREWGCISLIMGRDSVVDSVWCNDNRVYRLGIQLKINLNLRKSGYDAGQRRRRTYYWTRWPGRPLTQRTSCWRTYAVTLAMVTTWWWKRRHTVVGRRWLWRTGEGGGNIISKNLREMSWYEICFILLLAMKRSQKI
jgi:hypothetical protein